MWESKAAAAAILVGSALTACIAPPPKCICEEGGSASSDSGGGKGGSVEDKIKALDLQPAAVLAPLVWDGASIAMINVDPPGSWFAYNDGSPTGEMSPMGTADFEQNIVDGAIHAKGSGFKQWGGGIGLSFGGGAMLTPTDASKYKGISFKAWGKGGVHVGLASVATVPEFGICEEKAKKCYDHYAVDITLTEEPKVYSYPWEKLRQGGWGAPRTKLDPRYVIGLHFVSKGASPWDFYIDDITFIE